MKQSVTITLGHNFALTISPAEKPISIADEVACLYYDNASAQKNVILEINRNHSNDGINQSECLRICYPHAIISSFKIDAISNENNEFDQFISFEAPRSVVYNGILTVKLQSLLNKLNMDSVWDAEHTINLMALLLQILSASAHCCDLAIKSELLFECKFLVNDLSKQKIVVAQQYLHNNICEPITIKKLSMIVGMNECYLKKGFKETTGKTINDYFQQLRMDKAIELLKSKAMNVTEVSDYLGFKSLSHFSSVIKKLTGANACDIMGW